MLIKIIVLSETDIKYSCPYLPSHQTVFPVALLTLSGVNKPFFEKIDYRYSLKQSPSHKTTPVSSANNFAEEVNLEFVIMMGTWHL